MNHYITEITGHRINGYMLWHYFISPYRKIAIWNCDWSTKESTEMYRHLHNVENK